MTVSLSLHSFDSPIDERVEEVIPEGRFSTVELGKLSEQRWTQLAWIIVGIGAILALASLGWIASSLLIAAKITVIAISINLILGFALQRWVKQNTSLADDLENIHLFRTIPPSYICVIGPILEELLFRVGVQNALQMFLRSAITSPLVTLLGISMPATHVAAMVIAGLLFGVAHYSADREDNRQVFLASVSGIFVQGALYSAYGFAAAAFSHIINNTLAVIALEIGTEYFSSASTADEPAP